MVNCNSPLFSPRAIHGMPGEGEREGTALLPPVVTASRVSRSRFDGSGINREISNALLAIRSSLFHRVMEYYR